MDGSVDEATGGRVAFPWPEAPAPGETIEVADGVLWARLPLPMALDHVNVYALADDDGWTLVDTGIATRRGREAWEALLAGPLSGRPVRRVLVTHHHPDHIGLAGWFQAEHGAELIATRTAWLMARMLRLDEQAVPAPETLAFWQAAGMDPDILAERRDSRPFNFADVVAPMPLGFTRIAEGGEIALGGRRWRVMTGDGHAPEHATLWSLDDDLVIAGDQVLATISPNIGVYATEPEADPLREWLQSCARFAGIAREGHLALTGHRQPFTGLPARLADLIRGHETALDRLERALAKPRSAGGCIPVLFRRPLASGEYGLALVETVAHLNRLRAAGRAERHEGPDGVWIWQAEG